MKASVHAPGYLSPPEAFTQGRQRRDRRERERALSRFNFAQRSTTVHEATAMEAALRAALGPPKTKAPPVAAGGASKADCEANRATGQRTRTTLTLQGPAARRGKDGAA